MLIFNLVERFRSISLSCSRCSVLGTSCLRLYVHPTQRDARLSHWDLTASLVSLVAGVDEWTSLCRFARLHAMLRILRVPAKRVWVHGLLAAFSALSKGYVSVQLDLVPFVSLV